MQYKSFVLILVTTYLLLIGMLIACSVALPTRTVYPELYSGYFEGDIVLGKERIGLTNEKARWTNGVVPYVIDKGFSDSELSQINSAFQHFHANTCIVFRPKSDADTDYILIQNTDKLCYSSIGNRRHGEQIVNLETPLCTNNVGTILHELMHTLGFYHEHSRRDRNDYVTVIQDNINMDYVYNFVKYAVDYVTEFGIAYDYGSIMHYPQGAFSKNGKPTIVPKDPNAEIGQRVGLSRKDIERIGKMYKCPGY